jgi:hypothetical protein
MLSEKVFCHHSINLGFGLVEGELGQLFHYIKKERHDFKIWEAASYLFHA